MSYTYPQNYGYPNYGRYYPYVKHGANIDFPAHARNRPGCAPQIPVYAGSFPNYAYQQYQAQQYQQYQQYQKQCQQYQAQQYQQYQKQCQQYQAQKYQQQQCQQEEASGKLFSIIKTEPDTSDDDVCAINNYDTLTLKSTNENLTITGDKDTRTITFGGENLTTDDLTVRKRLFIHPKTDTIEIGAIDVQGPHLINVEDHSVIKVKNSAVNPLNVELEGGEEGQIVIIIVLDGDGGGINVAVVGGGLDIPINEAQQFIYADGGWRAC